MTVTKVRIRLIRPQENGKKRLKAIASVTLDNQLIINDIKVIKGNKRMCIEFPKHQFAKIAHLEYIVPLNPEVRQMFESSILSVYRKRVAQYRSHMRNKMQENHSLQAQTCEHSNGGGNRDVCK
jgi:stage V sporulation protein G